MMKKRKNVKACIILLMVFCALAYLIINNSEKTIKVKYNEFEDKINFNGFYFVDEHVLYSGDTKEIGMKYKSGDLVSKGTRVSNNIITNEAGMVITHLDGYENKYNMKNIKNITEKDINNVISNTKNISGIKIVNNKAAQSAAF
jgi:hypothetical protein